MNICFLYGKIVSNVKFDFFYNSKRHLSEACSVLKIINTEILIKIKGYDEIADTMYKTLKVNDTLQIIGYLEKNCVVITNIYKILE